LVYNIGVTHQIAIRLEDQDLAALDAEIAEGRAANRSDAVRQGIARLKRDQRYRADEAILIELAKRGEAVYPDLQGLADLPHPQLD
jgi:Arc/MetJ-type ribon-helix-helix transcriptional regulator